MNTIPKEESVAQTAQCGMCSGRGINANGSECEYCDCGVVDVPFDVIARIEAGIEARDLNYQGEFVAE